MRKTFLMLSLVAVTLAMTAGDVFAQRGRGFGGGRGVGGGWGNSFYGGGYGIGSGYGYGIGGYGYPGYGGYYGGYSRPYYGSYYSPYYGGQYYYPPAGYSYAPDYSYPDNYVTPAPDYRQSSYVDPNAATVTVRVPNADAQVWFDDAPTQQRGMERVFHTPALQQAGTYTLKARWNDGTRNIDQQRTVRVEPGQSVVIDFRAPPQK